FAGDALASLGRVGGGFALAVALGLPLGLISGRLRFMRLFLDTFINGVRAVPGIAWLPLALVWFGIGFKTTVFLVSLAAFFPIYLGAAAGAMQINPLFLQAGAMMGLGRGQLIFSVLVPAAMPHVVTGLRLGLGIAFAYLVLGELTGVPDGLGAAIMDARMLGRVDIIIMGILLIAIIGRICDLAMVGGLKLFKSVRRL
ncbi:MAG: ABC transporter permease subunit, partial [Desulfarculus sp.]|nr:ABC transporter permease subunit [Desulfarculus sp.]